MFDAKIITEVLKKGVANLTANISSTIAPENFKDLQLNISPELTVNPSMKLFEEVMLNYEPRAYSVHLGGITALIFALIMTGQFVWLVVLSAVLLALCGSSFGRAWSTARTNKHETPVATSKKNANHHFGDVPDQAEWQSADEALAECRCKFLHIIRMQELQMQKLQKWQIWRVNTPGTEVARLQSQLAAPQRMDTIRAEQKVQQRACKRAARNSGKHSQRKPILRQSQRQAGAEFKGRNQRHR